MDRYAYSRRALEAVRQHRCWRVTCNLIQRFCVLLCHASLPVVREGLSPPDRITGEIMGKCASFGNIRISRGAGSLGGTGAVPV